jgi:hypothetical protein
MITTPFTTFLFALIVVLFSTSAQLGASADNRFIKTIENVETLVESPVLQSQLVQIRNEWSTDFMLLDWPNCFEFKRLGCNCCPRTYK